MPLDPSFRSRLRDALRQSVVGRPANNPAIGRAEGGGQEAEGGAAADLHELRYEADEERQSADAGQAAWIADALGGWWKRDEGGVCLVIDREYHADRAHGCADVGCYGETLARYHRALREFDVRSTPAADTLFAALEDRDDSFSALIGGHPSTPFEGSPVEGHTSLGAGGGPPQQARTPDSGLRAQDADDRLLFFDLETTGLSGGAGTCAFLVGYGWFEAGGFRTRQYFLSGYAHEAALLRMSAEALDSITLATFNGKTFDVPLITGRYLFHRVPSPYDGIPHIDLLHPARRLWRHRPPDHADLGLPPSASRLPPDRQDAFSRYFRATALRDHFRGGRRYGLSASAASCALGALEEAVLGFRRTGDVPGAEVPSRYFHYARTGDVRPLVPVLEHNRLDLLSLAALASLVARMLEEGPDAARNGHECLALGRLYERSGAAARATACYRRAVEGTETAAWRQDPVVQREALRRLATRYRRERQHDAAAAAWQRLLDLSSANAGGIDFEALHALAVHHEHRSKDLHAARALVIRALDGVHDARLNEALRHRLARIERKLALEP